ncbi:hypothetical protein [Acetobacter senegalensis]|uniref:hypothetical protein n=1 Tax=Acetobacter senegalensis TaxID=446692 RepID=UPI00073EB596|nr:hypothetical protein [Acetobacter senegalensis]
MEHSFLDGFDDAPDLLFDPHLFHLPDISIGPALAIEAIGLLGIGTHGFGRDFRRHHPVLQSGEHAAFQIGARDGPTVGAGAVGDMA